MKLIDAVNGYLAAENLMREPCPYQTAAALVQLRGKLRDLAEYYLAEERKLIDRYAAKTEDGSVKMSGTGFAFAVPAQAPEYNARRAELGDTEVETDFPPRTLPAPERITPWSLEALTPFVTFEVR